MRTAALTVEPDAALGPAAQPRAGSRRPEPGQIGSDQPGRPEPAHLQLVGSQGTGRKSQEHESQRPGQKQEGPADARDHVGRVGGEDGRGVERGTDQLIKANRQTFGTRSDQKNRGQPAAGGRQLGAVRHLPVLASQKSSALRWRLGPLFQHDDSSAHGSNPELDLDLESETGVPALEVCRRAPADFLAT